MITKPLRGRSPRREMFERANEILKAAGLPPVPQARAATPKRYGVGNVREGFAKLLGGEPETPRPTPQPAQRPTGRALDTRAGLWRALDGVDMQSNVLVYTEGEPARLVSRDALLAWARKHARVLAADVETLHARDGWIATIKLASSGRVESVGALRVVAPPATRGTR